MNLFKGVQLQGARDCSHQQGQTFSPTLKRIRPLQDLFTDEKNLNIPRKLKNFGYQRQDINVQSAGISMTLEVDLILNHKLSLYSLKEQSSLNFDEDVNTEFVLEQTNYAQESVAPSPTQSFFNTFKNLDIGEPTSYLLCQFQNNEEQQIIYASRMLIRNLSDLPESDNPNVEYIENINLYFGCQYKAQKEYYLKSEPQEGQYKLKIELNTFNIFQNVKQPWILLLKNKKNQENMILLQIQQLQDVNMMIQEMNFEKTQDQHFPNYFGKFQPK